MLSKGNRSSHLLSSQSRRLMELREHGIIDHLRHLAMQELITEFYTVQGKAERIKKFPLPRQWVSANAYCISIFMFLLPFGMLDVFSPGSEVWTVFFAIPATVICFWVFWMMDRVGEYSENPFEGLANDVPIKTMARGIEIDIRAILDETDLPPNRGPVEGTDVLVRLGVPASAPTIGVHIDAGHGRGAANEARPRGLIWTSISRPRGCGHTVAQRVTWATAPL